MKIVAYKRLAKLPRVVLEGDMLRQIIAPYICRRGDEKKKPRKATYRIEEGEKL